jgi:hypothetical protein
MAAGRSASAEMSVFGFGGVEACRGGLSLMEAFEAFEGGVVVETRAGNGVGFIPAVNAYNSDPRSRTGGC